MSFNLTSYSVLRGIHAPAPDPQLLGSSQGILLNNNVKNASEKKTFGWYNLKYYIPTYKCNKTKILPTMRKETPEKTHILGLVGF